MKRRNLQFSVIAAAALAIIALAAVMLLAGGSPAQATATTETLALASDGGDGNPLPQQQGTPRHASPEPCPGETGNTNGRAASVVSSGQIALFDVYWNPVEGELTNTVCPPTAVHVPADPGDEDEERPATPAKDTRAPSGIDITAEPPTIIHIPSSARIDLSTSTTYTEAKYEDLWDADAAEDRDTNGDGTPDGVGDGIVWALPACPTDGSSFSGLCLSFSSALLNPTDWVGVDEKAEHTIDYLLNHVHQVDIDKQDPRYVLAYNVPADGAPKADDPVWNSHDAREGKVSVTPGGYNRPQWFFTDRGAYEFQVHIQGYPNLAEASDRADGLDPVSKDPSVTSDVREYILHVGAEADLGVEMSAPTQIPSSGTVNITITARNNNAVGQDEAQETKVDFTLPEGLTYSSHSTATGTYDSATGVWTIGELAPGASTTLSVTAKVFADLGKTLNLEATISATEPVKITETKKDDQGQDVKVVKTYHVPVPDPVPANNTAAVMSTTASSPNVAALFQVTRSVPANSPAGTYVGDPIWVREPNYDDTLTFGLTGEGADNFAAWTAMGGVQIVVASGANLQAGTSYPLVLTVSDGKDADGNLDSAVDSTIGVIINPPSLAVSASSHSLKKGEHVTLTATPSNLPQGHGPLTYRWLQTHSSNGHHVIHPREHGPTRRDSNVGGVGDITYYYGVEVSWIKDGVETRIPSSNQVKVTWTD